MKDDTISRQMAIDAINHELRCGAVIDQCGLETAYEIIEELPPAQSQRIRGRWEISSLTRGPIRYCSECGFGQYIEDERVYSFCPNCGADMRNDIDIVKDIIHRAIDNSIWAEDAYPNIKERLHKAVDEYEEENDE